MSSNNLDDNIYYVHGLFLDPPELNFTALKDAINKTKNVWQDNPQKDRVGKALLARTTQPVPPDTTLTNLANDALIARLKELNDQIDSDQADGILEQEEYDKTVRKFRKYFTEQTIKKLYRLPIYKFLPPQEPQEIRNGIKPTDKLIMQELDTLLEEVRAVVKKERGENKQDVLKEKFDVTKEVEDIYDILNAKFTVNRGSKYIDLKDAIEKSIRIEGITPNPGRGSALYKLFNKFKGERGIFATEDSKLGYDLALDMKSFNALIKSTLIGIAQKYQSGARISKGEYEHALKKARDANCWEAAWCVYDYFINQKKLKPPAEPIKDDRPLQCSICNTSNEKNANICMGCGSPLIKVKCPRCGREEKSITKICPQCGFTLADIPKAVTALENVRAALANGDITGTEKFMREVNTYWRECPGAEEVRKSIEEAKKDLATVQKQIDSLEKEIRTALGQRNLYEAQRLILKLREIPQAKSYLVEEERDVKKNLANIQTKLAQLPALSDTAKKIDICEEIIAVAADCKEAQDALVKYPPLPPSNLSAKVNAAGSVVLTWTSPVSRKPPTFVVVRKTNATPVSPADGQTIIDNLGNATFTDSQCEIGTIYGYAVFTKRDKVCEQTGSQSQLVQRIGELADIKVLPANSSVTFSWTKPANCIGIQITRYQSGSAQGTKLPLQHETGFTDSGLINGTNYTYLFQSVFRTAEGKTIDTVGVKREDVIPNLPPPAVLDLRTTDTAGGMTIFQWTPPTRGEVLLFNLARVPDIPVGQTEADTPLKLKEKYGEPIPIVNPKQGQTQYKNTITGVRDIVPFTVHNGLATIGKPSTLLRVQDVTNLDARISGERLYISWDWQKGQDKVLLAYRNDKQPEGVNDQNATRKFVTRQEYDRERAVVLSAENTQNFYIKVYSVVLYDGKEILSTGVETQTGVSEIDWKFIIRRKNYLFGIITDAKIQIECRSGKGIPDLIVRKDFNQKPLSRNFGAFVKEISRSSERIILVDIDVEHFADNARFQLFVKDEKTVKRYALYGQNDETMRFICQQLTFKDFVIELLFHPIRFIKQLRG